MIMMVHHNNHRHLFSSSERGDAADGPTCNSNRPPPVSNNKNSYDVVAGADAGAGAGVPAAGSSDAGAVLRALQPFDMSNRTNITPTTTTAHHNAFRSPVGGMTTYLGFPFTNAQWKELERQAMIYKYMVASLPVPRDLLFPIARGPPGPAISQSPLSSGYNLRLSNSTDPEPGRCKRTDGKKWRCSRDVAPDQKYCERHMHRGRPRSRKHVEVHATNTTKRVRHDNHALPTISPATAMSNISKPPISQNGSPTQFFGSTFQPYHDSPVFLEKDNVKVATFGSMTSASSDREPRSLEWMMKGEPVPMATSDPQWHHLMQSKTEVSSKFPFFDANSSVFIQRSEEESFLNLNSYAHFNAGEDQQDTDCNLFLNPDVVSLENHLLEEPPSRSFIDAWSKAVIDEKDNSSAPSSGQLSPSSLTLSMGGYNYMNEEMGQTQMSLGSNGSGMKPRLSTWLTPVSWVASPPGGPLAEVLKPSSLTLTAPTSATSNPSSPITGNGDLSSPLTTTVSSPSGVLQRTLVSMSDSSGCSSPTLASSKAKPAETIALWLDQRKA